MRAIRKNASPAPAADNAAGAGGVILAVEGLAKAFGQTQALRDCSFSIHAGQVQAIVGENGSGKSTLVKILAGVHRPDRGRLEVRGKRYDAFPSPRATLAVGVVAVFQEVLVVGPQSVLENIWIGVDGLFRVTEQFDHRGCDRVGNQPDLCGIVCIHRACHRLHRQHSKMRRCGARFRAAARCGIVTTSGTAGPVNTCKCLQ